MISYNHDPKNQKPVGVVTSYKIIYDNGTEQIIKITPFDSFDIESMERLVGSSSIKEIVVSIKKEISQ